MTENKDPELLEGDCGAGQEDAYDQLAVESIPFDPDQFELPDDFEFEGDSDD